MTRSVAIVIATREAGYAAEALRAAVGLGLRGARVVVEARSGIPDDDKSRRAVAALREAGHVVGGSAAGAEVVEIWGGDAWRAEIDRTPDHALLSVIMSGLSDRNGIEPTLPVAAGGVSKSEIRAILDLRGEVCPFTFVRTKLALEPLARGARLLVVIDHEPASRNIPRSAIEWGQHVISITPGDHGWDILIEKGTDPE